MDAKRFCLLLCLVCALSVTARAANQPIESPENLRFIQNAEHAYVFPLKNPGQSRRDVTHLRLLGTRARHDLLSILAQLQNWDTGLFLISQPPKQIPNVGLVFRHNGKELVLFFRDTTVEGQYGNKALTGMLDQEGKKQFEKWKQRYAQQELAPE